MDAAVFNEENILFDDQSQTQDEAFQAIANFAEKRGYVDSAVGFYQGLKKREADTTTGFKNGIAIPHSNDESIKEAGLFLVKFKNPIDWQALDHKPVRVAFALTIPKHGSKDHLKLLSLIARKLMDEDFIQAVLNQTDTKKLTQLISAI